MDICKLETREVGYKNIFLLSDIHLGVRGNSVEWLSNIKNFFYEFYIPFLRSNIEEGDVLFFLGDFFDNRQSLDISVLNAGLEIMTSLSKLLPVHIMVGNHDIYKKNDTDVNSVSAFKNIRNVYLYEKPTIVSNGSNSILIMPWVGDGDVEENYILSNHTDYIFAHTDISGLKYDNNKIISKGIDVTKIKQLKRLFSGHIHKRQDAGKYIYLGCPYQTKRSDIGNVKGVYKFYPEKNEVSFTKNTYSPVFQRIRLDVILDFTLRETSKVLENNYTDIIVPDAFVNVFNLSTFVDILKDCKYRKIETAIESNRPESELSDVSDEINIKDILSLLETSISDLGHQDDVTARLKHLNSSYYDKAYNEKDESVF